jgi:hypothetical protein
MLVHGPGMTGVDGPAARDVIDRAQRLLADLRELEMTSLGTENARRVRSRATAGRVADILTRHAEEEHRLDQDEAAAQLTSARTSLEEKAALQSAHIAGPAATSPDPKAGTGVQVICGGVSGPPAGGNGATLERIDRLLWDLAHVAATLDEEQAEGFADGIERLLAEVHRRKPNTHLIRHLLGELTAQVTSSAAAAAMIEGIKDLITALSRT